jgi:hypothetical protein
MKNREKTILYFLWIYAAVLFFVSGFLSLTRSGHESVIKEIDIILIVTLILIELINQVSYRLSKRTAQKASIIKCVAFWIVLSCSSIIYWFYLLKLEQQYSISWHKILGVTFFLLLFTFYIPFYSLDTTYRFLFLKGNSKSRG